MPEEPQEQGISGKDVEAVTEKLNEWLPSLPEQEQLVLGWVLTRAAAASEGDVRDYVTRNQAGVRASSLMADAAGLAEVTGHLDTSKIGPVNVPWTFRFLYP